MSQKSSEIFEKKNEADGIMLMEKSKTELRNMKLNIVRGTALYNPQTKTCEIRKEEGTGWGMKDGRLTEASFCGWASPELAAVALPGTQCRAV